MKDSEWTIGSTGWRVKGVGSVARSGRRWREDIAGQQGTVRTRIAQDRERWRTPVEATSCSGRTQPGIEQNKTTDRGNDGKTTSKSGQVLNGIYYYGKLRTARSGGSWL